MQQMRGYLIVQKPSVLYSQYLAGLRPEVRAYYDQLRDAFAFIEPSLYRGIDRKPLSYMHENTEPAAYKLLIEIVGDNRIDYDYNETLILNLNDAVRIRSLLTAPDNFEIIEIAREDAPLKSRQLGFDVGTWASDPYSIIFDTAIMPQWHPPDPEDFTEVLKMLRCLNDHQMFSHIEDARAFLSYYRNQSWAEEDDDNEFSVIRVGHVPQIRCL